MSKLWRAYIAAVEAFCFAGIGAILVIGTMQVVWRYAFNSSLFWSEEAMRYLMIWIVMIGAGLSYSRGQFLGMRLAVDRLPRGARRIIDAIGAVLMLVFLGVLLWFGTKFAWMTRLQTATALGVSMFWVHVAISVGAILLALHVALNEIFGIAREPKAEEHLMGAEEAL
ncbi:TRAP transporter small permease [Paracoccus sp. (in: a-proteobacteria)]|uniref:TRAP transporter small permease n=1 Tax=Paracoccus sp. TaxID=267 RepID=UPI00289AAA12|nr:TRAP transporter small permease [Paracoccus sp. (in: a-proteobacteria)]